MNPSRRFAALFRLALPLALSGVGLNAQVTYTLTDLGNLGNPWSNYSYSINDSGQVAGTSANATYRGFVYTPGAGMQDIGTSYPNNPWYKDSSAYAINGSGAATGVSQAADGGSYAIIYSGGTVTSLGSLGGITSVGYGINNAGSVVGYSMLASNTAYSAFLYSGGVMQDLGGSSSKAYAINNGGTVVGVSGGYAFVYANNTMTSLGSVLGAGGSSASAINDLGQIAGSAAVAGGAQHAFLYTAGSALDLGSLGGSSWANGINDSAQVVGGYDTTYNGFGVTFGFIYSNGQMLNLNSLVTLPAGWYITAAYDINNNGDIAAALRDSSGHYHAIVLSAVPVPEPASYALFAGLGAFLLLLWRQHRKEVSTRLHPWRQ